MLAAQARILATEGMNSLLEQIRLEATNRSLYTLIKDISDFQVSGLVELGYKIENCGGGWYKIRWSEK